MIYALGDRSPLVESNEVFVAPNAAVIGRVRLETRTSVWFNAVLRGDVEDIHVAAGSNIQDGAVLHADPGFPCRIGPNCTVGHLAMVHGCSVGEGSLIGIHATVLNGARIGKNCIIGANALVPEGKEIPDNSLVLGVPGKILRSVTNEEREVVALGVQHYQRNAEHFRTELSELDSVGH